MTFFLELDPPAATFVHGSRELEQYLSGLLLVDECVLRLEFKQSDEEAVKGQPACLKHVGFNLEAGLDELEDAIEAALKRLQGWCSRSSKAL